MQKPGQNERIGRILLIGVVILGIAFEALQPVVTLLAGAGAAFDSLAFVMQIAQAILLRMSLLILLFLEVFKGREWARWVLGILYLVSAALRYWPTIGSPLLQADPLDLAAIVVYLALGMVVLAAAPIRAYMASVRSK